MAKAVYNHEVCISLDQYSNDQLFLYKDIYFSLPRETALVQKTRTEGTPQPGYTTTKYHSSVLNPRAMQQDVQSHTRGISRESNSLCSVVNHIMDFHMLKMKLFS